MELLLIFGIGLASSLLGSFISGGVSAISIAALLAIGLPPHIALGSFRVGVLGFNLGGLREFIKAKQVLWKLLLPLSIIGIAGALIGSNIAVSLNEELLSKVMGLILLLFIPLTLFKPKLGVLKESVGKVKKYIGYFFYFLSTIWSGSVSAGSGLFILYIYMYFFGATIIETKGTAKIPEALLNIAAMIAFIYAGFVVWEYAIALLLGMGIGTFLGTKVVLRVGNEWLRYAVLASIFFMSIKLILGA